MRNLQAGITPRSFAGPTLKGASNALSCASYAPRNGKAVITSLILCLFGAYVSAAPYIPLSEQCDTYPKVPLGTAANLCVGLLVQKSPDIALKMPRTAVETSEGKLLVVDMGGWVGNKGKLWLIDYRTKTPTAVVLLSDLNLPHKILKGIDGKYYLGEAQRIIRFELAKDAVVRQETVIDSLPYHDDYLHPLKNVVFDKNNNLIVSVGSTSDRCKDNASNCTAGLEAGLWQFDYQAESAGWSKKYRIIASGLRNSMALAAHSSGTLLQAENSMDFPSAAEPYEEINVIELGGFYGWPVCYNRHVAVDETQKNCTAKHYREPWSLMPPHVAPLDALYYQHTKLPSLTNKLLMTWHGYKIVGHRLVAFDVDAQGRPVRTNAATYSSDPLKGGDGFNVQEFAAKGGVGLVAQHREIVSRWNEVGGLRPKGAPTGMSVMNDGSVLIVDDKNAAILRLSTGAPYQELAQKPEAKVASVTVTAPDAIRSILLNRCSKCHEPLQNSPEQILNANHWLVQTNGQTRMAQKLFEDKVMPMPPDNSLLPVERTQLKAWLDSLDKSN